MKTWPVQNAKARFSALLDTCLKKGLQIVSRRGADAAVLVPLGDRQRLQQAAKPTLKDLLLADAARDDRLVPERDRLRRRGPRATG